MSKSSHMKRKGGNVITKKMITQKADEMAIIMTALETTLMEWEIWYRMIPQQKKYLSDEQFFEFIKEGPILTELPGKIMESIRNQLPPAMTEEELNAMAAEDERNKATPKILGTDGLPVEKETKKIIV